MDFQPIWSYSQGGKDYDIFRQNNEEIHNENE